MKKISHYANGLECLIRTSTDSIRFMNPFPAIGFALVLLCGQVSVSHAISITLAPGGSTAATAEPFPAGGSILVSTTTEGFSSGSLFGTLISSVYNNDAGNQYGLADLTFTYKILLDQGSPDAASAISVGSFAGFSTDVSYNPDGGAAPTTISRDPNGSQVVFDFGGYILPGYDSALLIIQTDGTTVNVGSASIIDDIGTPGIQSFSPVPDTTGIESFILGLGLLAGFRLLTQAMSRRKLQETT